MTGVGDDSRGRSWGRPWFVVGLALAVVATIALVLASDIRYLRLGIVAALWAALVGAFIAVRYRKQAASTEEAVAQAQEVYELELEREIAARREYELEIESETRQRVDADSRAELDALRAEVGALRENLQSLFGGEVLLERLQLTAQATRMRALREEQRMVESPSTGTASRPALTAAKQPEITDRPTELIERVREKQPIRPGGRTAAPEPRRPERSLDLPPRRVARSEPRQNPGTPPASSVAKAAAEARAEQTRFQQAGTPPPPSKKVEPRKAVPAEPPRPAFNRSERSRPAMKPPEPDPVEQPTQLSKALDPDWTPSRENRISRDRPVNDLSAAFPVRDVPAGNGNGHPPRKPAEPEPVRPVRAGTAKAVEGGEHANAPSTVRRGPASGPTSVERTETQPVARREPERPVEPPRAEKPPVNTMPDESRLLAQQQGRSGGRRRRPEDDNPPPEPAAAPEAGGRRRRPDGEPPSWMQSTSVEGGGRRRAGHSRPEIEPVSPEAAQPNGRRATPDESDDTGSHSAGRSVSELLAAHGTTGATPRRRRRADD